MAVAMILVFGVVGALVPVVVFVAAKAKPADIVLAAVGYGGMVATIASMGTYYRAGPYLFVPLASLFTAAWMLATVRVVRYRSLKWRWHREAPDAQSAVESKL